MEDTGRLDVVAPEARRPRRVLGVLDGAWVLASFLECLVLAAGLCWLARTHTRPGVWLRILIVAGAGSVTGAMFLAAAARARQIR